MIPENHNKPKSCSPRVPLLSCISSVMGDGPESRRKINYIPFKATTASYRFTVDLPTDWVKIFVFLLDKCHFLWPNKVYYGQQVSNFLIFLFC